MSSPFASVLAKLDDSIAAVQLQVDRLRDGFDVDEQVLSRNLHELYAQAANMRELVRAERPDADWSDRKSLDILIHDIVVAAQERQLQLRRAKLLDLADELSVGNIQHRFEARAAALDSLRQDAVNALRGMALATEITELPGPAAGEWLGWACSLDEQRDASDIQILHKDFSPLELFTSEMEERYWVPGKREPGVPGQVTLPPAPRPEKKAANPIVFPKPPAAPANGEGVAAGASVSAHEPKGNGSATSAFERTFGPGAKPRSSKGATWAASATAVAVETVAVPQVNHCEKCGASYSGAVHVCPVGDPVSKPEPEKSNGKATAAATAAVAPAFGHVSVDDAAAQLASERAARDAAEIELARLKALVEQRGAMSGMLEEEEQRPSWRDVLGAQRLMTIAGAVGLVLVIAIIMALLHFTASKSEPPAKVAAAPPQPAVAPIQDADVQKAIDQRLATLKGVSIQATVQGPIVTLEGKASSKDDLLKAEDLISDVNGVRVVRDNVQIDQRGAQTAKKR